MGLMELMVKLLIFMIVGCGLLLGITVGLKNYFDSDYEKALGIAFLVAMIVMPILGCYLGIYAIEIE